MGAVSEAVEKKNAAPAKASVENTVAHMVQNQQAQIARALPRLMDPARFTRILVTELKANPGLMRCEPTSMLAAVMKAASLGLEPGPLGHAYLVPFKNNKTGKTEVQFMIGYKGVIELARRSGKIKELYGEVVYEGDDFEYQLGLNRDLKHNRTDDSNRDKITHAYAIAKYLDGGVDFVVLDEFDIASRRKRSKASSNGPWVTDFPAMALKSAFHALKKFLPLTVEVADALQADERSYDLTDMGDIIDVPEDETAELAAPVEPVKPDVVDTATGEIVEQKQEATT